MNKKPSHFLERIYKLAQRVSEEANPSIVGRKLGEICVIAQHYEEASKVYPYLAPPFIAIGRFLCSKDPANFLVSAADLVGGQLPVCASFRSTQHPLNAVSILVEAASHNGTPVDSKAKYFNLLRVYGGNSQLVTGTLSLLRKEIPPLVLLKAGAPRIHTPPNSNSFLETLGFSPQNPVPWQIEADFFTHKMSDMIEFISTSSPNEEPASATVIPLSGKRRKRPSVIPLRPVAGPGKVVRLPAFAPTKED